jgi:hypothetical protein
MNKIKAIVKNKKIILGTAVIIILVVLLLPRSVYLGQLPPVVSPDTPGNQSPPVVQTAPELNLVTVNPPEGPRETFDTFAQTFFEFSADVDQTTARITVTPTITVKATVYDSEKKVLVIEPTKKAWTDGVAYTITINRGLRGVGGEELRQDVSYSFSNTQPEVFEGGDPIPGN